MDLYNRVLRRRLRELVSRPPVTRTDGTLYRVGAPIGEAGGIKYTKSYRGYTISIAGQTADQPDGEYLMVLWPDEPPTAQEGDELAIGDARYRILSARDIGAYQLWRLELIP